MIRNWIASLLPGANPAFAGSVLLRESRFVVFDTELTSLDLKSNRMLSIGAIAMRGTQIRLGEQFYRLVNPSEDVPRESILIHGLRPADIAKGDSPAQVVRDFLEFAKDAILVGQHVSIDLQALRKEVQETFPNPHLCTARAAHWLYLQHEQKRGVDDVEVEFNLAALARRYGIEAAEAHHALGDAFTTAQLWQRLLLELEQHGITTLGSALRIARG